MGIKIFLLLFILVSCGGPDVKFTNNNLEEKSVLTDGQIDSFYKSGNIYKKTITTVEFQGQIYKVSSYSSKFATDFIASLPMGAQMPIRFTGGTNGTEIVLENIKRQ